MEGCKITPIYLVCATSKLFYYIHQALNTLKASAKAKLADNHNVVEGTNKRFLTRLEEKIVAIFGMDALDGDQELGETGFQYEEVSVF